METEPSSKRHSVVRWRKIGVSLADAVIALTANLAIAQGKATEQNARIDFAPEWFDIDSDETPEGEPPNVDRPEYQT